MLSDCAKWWSKKRSNRIRSNIFCNTNIQARGNKEGVNAQFSLDKEQLAFPICVEKGEEDGFVIYPDPDVKVLGKFKSYKTRTVLWGDLPVELGYNS